MPLSLLPTLLMWIFAVGYTPGPANLYALSCSLKYGRRAALGMWWGLLAGFCVAAVAVALAVHLLGRAMGDYVVWLKYPGAAYIFWLAWQIWRSGDADEGLTGACSFWSGFIVQLTNAKMILFDLTVFGTFVLPYSSRLTDLLIVAAWLVLAGPGANLVWLLLGSWLRRLFGSYQRGTRAAMALLLAACAVYLLVST